MLREFVLAGAPPEIEHVSKPHIGTFRLVTMVEKMRDNIIALGGEVRFESRVADIEISNHQVVGVTLANGAQIQPLAMWCWPSATARAIPSRCCISVVYIWKPSRSR